MQMPDAWMEQKRQAVMKYRSLFIYTTAPQDEPSASDALIDLMCSHAKSVASKRAEGSHIWVRSVSALSSDGH